MLSFYLQNYRWLLSFRASYCNGIVCTKHWMTELKKHVLPMFVMPKVVRYPRQSLPLSSASMLASVAV